MKDTEYPEPKKLPTKHLLEYPNRTRQLPKELLELQDYLKQFSVYVEKYNRITDNIARPSPGENEGKWGKSKDFPYREMGFSVKEEIAESSPVQIIEMTPPEEVLLISGHEKMGERGCEDEKELSSIISNPVGKTGPDLASDKSQIGIYFIEHVKPVNFVNILQRELSTLGSIFPDACDITEQITQEFDHFKVCQKCLDKVSPLLPEILKELQELIKFVKKKRNEEYVWPDDSEYLRKTPQGLSKPFGKHFKEVEKKKIRQETVGFLTVHTNTPQIIKECEANFKGEPRGREQSEHTKKSWMRVGKGSQLTILQPNIQTYFTRIEKAEIAEFETPVQKRRSPFCESSFVTEFSTSQVIKTLHPGPVLQIVLQYKVRGNVDYLVKEVDSEGAQSKGVTDPEPDREGFENSQALEVREFLLTAKTELTKACKEIEIESRGNRKMDNELKTSVKDLKNLMLEVHRNQIELSKVLLEKEILNPAIIQLSDPRVLCEEKEGIRKIQISLSKTNLDNLRREDLQCLLDKLKSKCEMKNRLILSLLKGLRSNIAHEEWQELTMGIMQGSTSVTQSLNENASDCLNLKPFSYSEPENVSRHPAWKDYTQSQLTVDEILSEKEIARATYEQSVLTARDSTRVMSFSDITTNNSEWLPDVDEVTRKEPAMLKAKSFTMKQVNIETEKLFKELENEVNSLTFEHNKILCEIEGLKRQNSIADQAEENKTAGSRSGTINFTIKIGDQDSMSGYHSALSIVPSGATLKEKKSELSFPVNMREVSQDPGSKYSIQEFKSALNLSIEQLSKRHFTVRKSTKSFTSLALKLKLPVFFKNEGTNFAPQGKPENSVPVPLDLDATCTSAWKSKHPISRRGNVSGSYANEDFSFNEEISKSHVLVSEFSHLQPQMNIHCEQNQAIRKLRSRMRFLEEDLHCLKTTIDRMGILTEKLVDDARESSENFKSIYKIFHFITSQANV